MELTEKQREILRYIEEFAGENGAPPTIREIGSRFSLSSTGSVRDHLKALAAKRYIDCIPGKSRGIKLLRKTRLSSIPVAGRIVAGAPGLATENIDGEIEVGERLAGRVSFALRVKGDSMAGAGIQEGDYVIVHQQSTCEQGEIVIAMTGDEATVKRFRRKGKKIILEPANPAYSPIETDGDVRIIGKVVGLIRYYK
jgi:repressor LexA